MMDSFASPYKVLLPLCNIQTPSTFPIHRDCERKSSTALTEEVGTGAQSRRTNSIFTTASTAPSEIVSQDSADTRAYTDHEMTTYYHYGPNGVTASCSDPFARFTHGYSVTCPNMDPVGAYLARRQLLNQFKLPLGTNYSKGYVWGNYGKKDMSTGRAERIKERDDGCYSEDKLFYDQISISTENSHIPVPISNVSQHPPYPYLSAQGHQSCSYPDIDSIRHLHTLHSLLPYIQPERKHNALLGPRADIVDEDTLTTLLYRVPKKLLVLFCGRATISKFLRTEEHADKNNGKGTPIYQELRIPRGRANHIGLKILVAWMQRACQRETTNDIEPIRVPKNLFAAISLARTLEALGLHRDANRVDITIVNNHFRRPIFVDELKSVWKCLRNDSKYTFRVVEILSNRLMEYEAGRKNALPQAEEVFMFLDENPELNARVRNLSINKRFQPSFSTDWCRYTGHELQHREIPKRWCSKGSGIRNMATISKVPPVNAEALGRELAFLRIVPGGTMETSPAGSRNDSGVDLNEYLKDTTPNIMW